METVKKKSFTLPDKKVSIVPVRRKGGWLPEGHENTFLFKHSYYKVGVPRNGRSGEFVNPLTPEEQEYFESDKSGLALDKGAMSIYRDEKNYWDKFTVTLDKNVLVLDLSRPMDYLKYKVLLTNKDTIAPSADQKFMKGTYKFAIVEEGYESREKVKKAESSTEAYTMFGQMTDSTLKMTNFLNVYYYDKPGKKTVAPDSTREFLVSEVANVLENDIKGFLTVLKDPDYSTKAIIYQALRAGALSREDLAFKIKDGETIGESLSQVVAFFNDPMNNEEVLKIKARIDNSN